MTFADNLLRLAGLHELLMRDVAAFADVSESVVSKWQTGDRNPSFTSALKIGALFEIEPGRLAQADFADLLSHELADPDRYRRVEEKIERLRREWSGEEKALPIGKQRGPKKAR
jgi:transcriptional regulator with XRE-family HTH domain